MDILLSENMNGIEAANIIFRKYNVPVIYLTALTDDESFLNAKEFHSFPYLNKPFEEKDLDSAIISCLRNN
jgi:DNA-binding response OmpR family regulator